MSTSATVVACLSPADLRPDVDPLSAAIVRDPARITLSPADAAALELALRVAASWSARVLAIAAGPPAIEHALREARAAGADVLRLAWPGDDLVGDQRQCATAAAEVIGPLQPRLVICGDRSPDRGSGAFPALLAHELGAAQALGLVSLGVDGDRLLAERRLDRGWRERLVVPTPAVCSVEGAGVRLRRGTLAMALVAAQQQVEVADPQPPAPDTVIPEGIEPLRPRTRVVPPPSGPTPRDRLLALTGALTVPDQPVVVEPQDAGAAAEALLEYLRVRGYLPIAGTTRATTAQ